ncbi:endonuclease domain-containing protein [Psychroflexus sp. CAK1W]|uniref:endonuclease domain-containing protein n=1 Tax=Psychroflexus curvus TaxID=2873595 RepID=UPI001CCF6C88|nr:endonuclease domain-containing protein [Psychroflexus curvus]MBZ9629073.1 endonuclease domain-containing protein [Psychroflexus curvus]
MDYMMKKSPYHQDSMFKGASPEIFLKAKKLRQNLTEAEKVLWELLRSKETLGHRFRRQHPFGNYILDFYNHELKLCIEIDGEYHFKKEQKEKDDDREDFLNFNEISIIRYTNDQVLNDIQSVLKDLKRAIKKIEN